MSSLCQQRKGSQWARISGHAPKSTSSWMFYMCMCACVCLCVFVYAAAAVRPGCSGASKTSAPAFRLKEMAKKEIAVKRKYVLNGNCTYGRMTTSMESPLCFRHANRALCGICRIGSHGRSTGINCWGGRRLETENLMRYVSRWQR